MDTNPRNPESLKTSLSLPPKSLDGIGSLLKSVNREVKILTTVHRALRGLVTARAEAKDIFDLFRLASQAAETLETASQELTAFLAALISQVIREASAQQAHPQGNGQAPLSLDESAEHRAEELLQRYAKDGVLKS
jgi:hypothetical protein